MHRMISSIIFVTWSRLYCFSRWYVRGIDKTDPEKPIYEDTMVQNLTVWAFVVWISIDLINLQLIFGVRLSFKIHIDNGMSFCGVDMHWSDYIQYPQNSILTFSWVNIVGCVPTQIDYYVLIFIIRK